jgi:hypothetical protein
MPFSGLIEFNLVTIVPNTVFGYEMFNFFFTLVFITGMISWGLGAVFGLFKRS